MALTLIHEIPQDYQKLPLEESKIALQEFDEIDSRIPGSSKVINFEDFLDSGITWGMTPFSIEKSFENLRIGFNTSPKPWLPPKLKQKLEKLRRMTIGKDEMVNLMEEIAKISIDFYKVRLKTFVAVRLFDGKIAESAGTEIDLLLRIQGKDFGTPIFVWQVGSKSFTGWRT